MVDNLVLIKLHIEKQKYYNVLGVISTLIFITFTFRCFFQITINVKICIFLAEIVIDVEFTMINKSTIDLKY